VLGARSANELTAMLDRSGVRYRTGMTVQAPENVPLQQLDALAKRGEGQSMIVSESPAVRIWTIVKTQDARVDRQQAREPIETYLLTERKRQQVAARMQELRKAAQVTYADRFAAAASGAVATASN